MFTLIYKGAPHVIVNITEEAANAALDAIGGMMDGGAIELLSGNGTALAVLKLSNPAAQDASDGELLFNKIAEGDAVAAGQAVTARILSADGSEVFSCDVGDLNSDAVVKLNSVVITHSQVRINSFRLSMP